MREALADNKHLAAKTINVLMRNEHDEVRVRLVRRRKAVPPSVQRHPGTDSNNDIRIYVARSQDLSNEVQNLLAKDQSSNVA